MLSVIFSYYVLPCGPSPPRVDRILMLCFCALVVPLIDLLFAGVVLLCAGANMCIRIHYYEAVNMTRSLEPWFPPFCFTAAVDGAWHDTWSAKFRIRPPNHIICRSEEF